MQFISDFVVAVLYYQLNMDTLKVFVKALMKGHQKITHLLLFWIENHAKITDK